jgi:hypothetical protein
VINTALKKRCSASRRGRIATKLWEMIGDVVRPLYVKKSNERA